MASRSWSAAKDSRAKSAREGDHWAARMASMTPPKFEVGEPVRVKKTQMLTTVTGLGHWGYTLAGLKGYFPSDTRERLLRMFL